MTSIWQDPAYAANWAQHDALSQFLDTPRQIALAVMAEAGTDLGLAADIGSGPGDFLAAFLTRFPAARGIWWDVSAAMRDIAQSRLGEFGDRVNYRLGDLTEVNTLPDRLGVIITSRALHHLTVPELRGFYGRAAAGLSPGGWIANIDHVRLGDPWGQRARAARTRLLGPNRATHPHLHPLPSLTDHLDAMRAAGFGDAGVVWQAFATHLIMGQKGQDLAP
jgi:trans-aconitate methyltransferase